MILSSFGTTVWRTDGRTDGIAVANTALHCKQCGRAVKISLILLHYQPPGLCNNINVLAKNCQAANEGGIPRLRAGSATVQSIAIIGLRFRVNRSTALGVSFWVIFVVPSAAVIICRHIRSRVILSRLCCAICNRYPQFGGGNTEHSCSTWHWRLNVHLSWLSGHFPGMYVFHSLSDSQVTTSAHMPIQDEVGCTTCKSQAVRWHSIYETFCGFLVLISL